MTAPLATQPARLAVANLIRTGAALALLSIVVLGLKLIFGRTGERIAVQMSVNVVAVVALAVFCGNTGIVSFGHGAFMAFGAYLWASLPCPRRCSAQPFQSFRAFWPGMS